LHPSQMDALALPRAQPFLLPEIVYRIQELEYTHRGNLLVRDTAFLLCSILPGFATYVELTLKYIEMYGL
jgi:hypothetical protein